MENKTWEKPEAQEIKGDGTTKVLQEVAKALNKLSRYERTGLTPRQITQIDEMYAEKCRELAKTKKATTEDARKTISQLEDLHAHCMGMIDREEEGEVWEEDCKALEAAIEAVKQQDAKNSMRIYLSGPIAGTDDYMERFAKAEERLTEQGYHVINPAKMLASLPSGFEHEEYMLICMGLLTACKTICMLEGWESSPGANREYGYAFARNMHIAPMKLFE